MPSAQGFILKAPTSTCFYPEYAAWVDQQTGLVWVPAHSRSTFNGKRISSHQFPGGTATLPDYGKSIEDAFWEKKPVQGRQITTAAVLGAYGNDRTSLRGGFFLQKLCLQNILHNGKKITTVQVIQEFNREPDRNNKCQLAIARFKQQCCLKELALNGRKVTPDEVVKDFPDSPEGKLGLARFRQQCCLRGLPLNGRLVTTDEVVKGYPDSKEGKLGLARFKADCCLRGLALNGQLLTTDAVVKEYLAINAALELAHFKEECYLRDLPLSGRQVTSDEVVKAFLNSPGGKLGMALFKERCCLSGLALNGQQITPDALVQDYQAARGTLELARFKEACCLRSVPLNGRQVTPEAVVKGYQAARATLELARFKEECCLRGLALNGQQVTPDEVVEDFQTAKSTLELAHFKTECCIKGLALHGQQLTPDEVIKDFPDSPEGRLGAVRFKAECCLRGWPLNGQQLTPDAVVKDYQAFKAKLELGRFKAECCLRGLLLNGQPVTPDVVVMEYPNSPEGKRGIAYFKERCCLRGLSLNGQLITPDEVIQDYQAIKATIELVRFKAECCLRGLALNGQLVTPDAVVKDYQTVKAPLELARFQGECCLRDWPLNGQQVTLDAVVKGYQTAKAPLELVHFKAECCLRGLTLNGQQFTPDEVVRDFERGGWLLERDSFYSRLALNANLLDSSGPGCLPGNDKRHSAHRINNAGTVFPDNPATRSHTLTLKTLDIIQEVNGFYIHPAILITGSYARFLQNLCPIFNDIDIICTTEESASVLFDKLQALHIDRNETFPNSITIRPIPGCQAIRLPNGYNIRLKDGDLDRQTVAFKVSIDDRVIHENAEQLAIYVPGVKRPVWFLSFTEETRLLNDTLKHLAENLDPLTEQLQNGAVLDLPRTLLFNNPQNNSERIYGLLMRSLFTLNKARRFITLHSEVKPTIPDCYQRREEQRRLHTLAANLQAKLSGHVCRHDFEHRVNGWLSTTQHINDYEIKRKEFIKELLAIMNPDQVNPTP
ncbi:hypothetical protein [Endozoicomonas sp. GU-1]|uniref:hypothetical protein n=1 Tax=Endozoicomonas sp. GU-1 TaxID=3009078 RepID=UPI0022B5C3F2|nr:hypothetical protein [Endozoicomonas sp. GU-1]WBA83239.1 hypothetical protein O2T12_09035 [Endozoicomonas sp. GU-1]WBA86164.1 hypothetical protein O3276_23665 [Endozoicomonas sp. GU-1]